MKKILFLVSVIFLSLVSFQNVSACSCIAPDGPEVSKERASAVFIGKVESIKESSVTQEIIGKIRTKKVNFQVYEDLKGVDGKEVSIMTNNNSAACGYNFEEGREYIVYASGEKDNLETSICSRTTTIENAAEDLEYFGINDKNPEESITSEEENDLEVLLGNEDTNNDGDIDQKEKNFGIIYYIILSVILVGIIILISKNITKNSKKNH